MSDSNRISFDDIADSAGIKAGFDKMLSEYLAALNKMKSEAKTAAGGAGTSISGNKGNTSADLKQLAKDIELVEKAQKTLTAAEEAEIKVRQAAKEQIKNREMLLNAEAKSMVYAEGSMKKLNAELEINRMKYRNLSQAQRDNAAVGGKLLTTIQAQDTAIKKLDADMGNHQRNVGAYGTAIAGLKSQFGTIFTAAGLAGLAVNTISQAFSSGKQFVIDSVKAYEEQIKSERVLLFAMDGRIDATNRLIELAGELQFVSGVDDETIKSQMAYLALQGRSEVQIKKTIQAALDFSAATGESFEGVVKKFDGTMNGVLGKLKKYDASLKELTPAQLAAGAAIDILGKKFSGVAEKSVTLSEKLKIAGDELKEALGERSSGFINNIREGIFNIVKGLGEWIAIPLSEKLKKENDDLNDMVYAITQVNDNNEDRNKLIAELNNKYPEFLANLDAENVSNDELLTKLAAVNEQYSQKAFFMEYEKQITENLEKQKDAYDDQLAALKKVSSAYTDFMKIAYIANAAAAASIDKTKDWAEKFKIIKASFGGIGGTGTQVAALKVAYDEFNKTYKETTTLVSSQNLKLAEEAVTNALQIEGAISLVPESILKIAKASKDASIAEAAYYELLNRKSVEFAITGRKRVALTAEEIKALNEKNKKDKEITITAEKEKTAWEKLNEQISYYTKLQTEAILQNNPELVKSISDLLKTLTKEKEAVEALQKAYNDTTEAKKELASPEKQMTWTDKYLEKVKQDAEDYKTAEEKKKAAEKDLLDATVETTNAIIESYVKRSDEKQASLDKELEASKKYEDQLRELAKTGIEGATENLAFEQKKQAEIEAKKLQEQKKQKRLELGMAAISAFGKIAETDPDKALVKTITEITKLLAFINTIPAFAEGVIEFKGKGTTKSDSNIVKLSDKESIIKAEATAMYKPQLKAMNELKYNPFDYINIPKDRMQQNATDYGVIKEIQVLNETLKNKTEYSIDINGLTHEIIERVQRGNTIVINNHKPKGLF